MWNGKSHAWTLRKIKLNNRNNDSPRSLIYRRMKLIFWPINIHQEYLVILKPMVLLLGLWLDHFSSYTFSINTVCPKSSTDMHKAEFAFPKLQFLFYSRVKLHVWPFKLASVYLFIYADNLFSNASLQIIAFSCDGLQLHWTLLMAHRHTLASVTSVHTTC